MRQRSLAFALPIALVISACGPLPGGGGDGGGREGEGEDEDDLCDGCCFDAATDCRSSEICRFQANESDSEPGECLGADGASYLVAVGPLVLCERDPDGAEWDAGAGAPDPIIQIVVNGAEAARSVAVQDRFTSFEQEFVTTITLRSNDSVTIQVLDEDFTEDDFGGGFCLGSACNGPVGVDTLRGFLQDIQGDCGPGGVESMKVLLVADLN